MIGIWVSQCLYVVVGYTHDHGTIRQRFHFSSIPLSNRAPESVNQLVSPTLATLFMVNPSPTGPPWCVLL